MLCAAYELSLTVRLSARFGRNFVLSGQSLWTLWHRRPCATYRQAKVLLTGLDELQGQIEPPKLSFLGHHCFSSSGAGGDTESAPYLLGYCILVHAPACIEGTATLLWPGLGYVCLSVTSLSASSLSWFSCGRALCATRSYDKHDLADRLAVHAYSSE